MVRLAEAASGRPAGLVVLGEVTLGVPLGSMSPNVVARPRLPIVELDAGGLTVPKTGQALAWRTAVAPVVPGVPVPSGAVASVARTAGMTRVVGRTGRVGDVAKTPVRYRAGGPALATPPNGDALTVPVRAGALIRAGLLVLGGVPGPTLVPLIGVVARITRTGPSAGNPTAAAQARSEAIVVSGRTLASRVGPSASGQGSAGPGRTGQRARANRGLVRPRLEREGPGRTGERTAGDPVGPIAAWAAGAPGPMTP